MVDGKATDMAEPAKILVVDDDPDFLDSTRAMLTGRGYRVAVAAGEEEALTEIEADRPDLVILDVMMSRCDSGFLLMCQMKADERYAAIPILMVTAVDTKAGMDFAGRAGRAADDGQHPSADGYIVKPVTTAKLLSSVQSIVEQTKPRVVSR
jgi:CheY-like chemotaxis protein